MGLAQSHRGSLHLSCVAEEFPWAPQTSVCMPPGPAGHGAGHLAAGFLFCDRLLVPSEQGDPGLE